MDYELAGIEQYREDAHYEVRPDTQTKEEIDMRQTIESIEIEGEEDGWELVVTTDAEVHRFNAHRIASTDELEAQLQKVLDQINDWKAGA